MHGSRTVIAQRQVDTRSNEITAFWPLLEPLDLRGKVVTFDAMHSQTEHARFLVEEKNAHYIALIKDNHPTLHARLRKLPWHEIPLMDKTRATAHGRDEIRRIKVATVPGLHFPHTDQVLQIVRRSRVLSTGKLSIERVYALTDLTMTPGHPGPACRARARALGHRSPAPPARRHPPRRRLQDPHGQRTPRHGRPAQHRPRPGRTRRLAQPRSSRRSLPVPPRPRTRPDQAHDVRTHAPWWPGRAVRGANPYGRVGGCDRKSGAPPKASQEHGPHWAPTASCAPAQPISGRSRTGALRCGSSSHRSAQRSHQDGSRRGFAVSPAITHLSRTGRTLSDQKALTCNFVPALE
ncbi:ISAs1 family transposase [Streptomyces sp. TRM68367]|nr:ISAs1 family transposase [Streptomyces sp. TRM68367]